MKQLRFITLILIVKCGILSAQEPQPVYSIVIEHQPHEFYVEQAELWWKEIDKDRSHEKAWYYYYKANRYARMTFKNCDTPETEKASKWTDENEYLRELDVITDMINKEIPNTYTCYILWKDGWHDEERYEALLKAYEMEPDNPDTYDELVVYYEISGQREKRREFNEIWYRSNELSPGILNYNYNVLQSMDQSGILLTFGDNDTFPVWLLQDALSVRRDIAVLNLSLLTINEYRALVFSKLGIPDLEVKLEGSTSGTTEKLIDHIIQHKPASLPLYTSTPAWKSFQKYEENMFLTGLVLTYSEENMDNLALLKNNFENRYALDYIESVFSYDIGRGVAERMNVNYLPGIIKLYEHYKLSGEVEKVNEMKEIGLLIADKGGEEWKTKAAKILK